MVDMSRGFESLYVYTNVVEPRFIGDILLPLLCIILLNSELGETMSRSFEKIQYVPVLCKEFCSFKIDIRDDTGGPVPFESGKVIVTLHFRRCRTKHF